MDKYNWNLKDIFETQDDFYNAQMEIEQKLKKIQTYRGKLNESSDMLYNCYREYETALELYEKFYAYGMLSYHLDMANNENIKLYKTVESFRVEFEKFTSFIIPEIMKMENERILEFINNDSRLQRYKRKIEEILENKKHILTEKEEELLTNYSEIFGGMENTFDILTNIEFKFGKIKDSKDEEVELNDANYTYYLKDKDRRVRKDAFSLMYKKYSEFLHTITELYINKVKEDTITSKIREYSSSLEKAVINDDATQKVYASLVEAVNKNIHINHNFMSLKKKLLNIDEMHLYDIYVNPIEIEEDNISYEEASAQIVDALSILGEEYADKLKEAFNNNWIDVFSKENKMGGAYNMGVYGCHPYVLTNFMNKKRDVSTIAHELGHAMHSYYSNSNQNVIDADYTIMVAEIASTVNEILLARYQINREKDKIKRNELIYELLEMFRATLFRQTMFAEFEREVHNKVEHNEMLTAEDLNQIYYELNKKYFGNDVVIDTEIQYEWARIPHFYRPFYVYKYATGISAAVIIAKNILEHKEGYAEKYIEMLKKGCTKKSVELLKMVDVDLEDVSTYENAILWMQDLINELK